MNVFIDANIFLTFYHLSDEDLEELQKAFVLHERQRITIWLPDQVKDEVCRNRETRIADALKRFNEEKLNNQIPQMMKSYEDYERLRNATRAFTEAKNRLLEQLQTDIQEKTLKADRIITAIFGKAKRIEFTPAIFTSAKIRSDRGNPPGKVGSYGDAINWESLLQAISDREDLHIVSEDSDYFSKVDPEKPNQFLLEDWESKKGSKVYTWKRLSRFISTHFPNAKLASEFEKECLISDLAVSGNFAQTHLLIARLQGYSEFTTTQANDIIDAITSNNQVSWIISDEDVLQFAKRVLNDHRTAADEDKINALENLIPKESE